MAVIALDLGGTKLASALFSSTGAISHRSTYPLPEARGEAVSELVAAAIHTLLEKQPSTEPITGIGIGVPGIYRSQSRTVWAPNIAGWEDFSLWERLQDVSQGVEVFVDSDRACCILGEVWQGAAQGCKDAIFMTVGTGIGAGILTDGRLLRGAHDIGGAIGWMALNRPYRPDYDQCGCFEQYASGEGIAKTAKSMLRANPGYNGALGVLPTEELTAHHVFSAYANGNPLAKQIIDHTIQLWGMATANLVSIFNPEKIIFGGGVFGPATIFLEQIREEAAQWAQPISMQHVQFEVTVLGADAGLYGAAYLALNKA